jgi:hypothetical protein
MNEALDSKLLKEGKFIITEHRLASLIERVERVLGFINKQKPFLLELAEDNAYL